MTNQGILIRHIQKKEALRLPLSAVRGGFEPPVRLPVRQFSKLVVSATHPSHQVPSTYGFIAQTSVGTANVCIFFLRTKL